MTILNNNEILRKSGLEGKVDKTPAEVKELEALTAKADVPGPGTGSVKAPNTQQGTVPGQSTVPGTNTQQPDQPTTQPGHVTDYGQTVTQPGNVTGPGPTTTRNI